MTTLHAVLGEGMVDRTVTLLWSLVTAGLNCHLPNIKRGGGIKKREGGSFVTGNCHLPNIKAGRV
jgi:hypothetical protein